VEPVLADQTVPVLEPDANLPNNESASDCWRQDGYYL